MCDPVSAGIALTAGSGLFSAYQANQQGKFQNRVAQQNARNLEASADDASRRGIAEGENQRNRYQNLIGQQVTSTAASGLDVTSGSPLDIFAETAELGEFDAQVIESNARRQAYGLQSEAAGQRAQGRMARTAGRNRAFSTLLASGGRATNMGQNL